MRCHSCGERCRAGDVVSGTLPKAVGLKQHLGHDLSPGLSFQQGHSPLSHRGDGKGKWDGERRKSDAQCHQDTFPGCGYGPQHLACVGLALPQKASFSPASGCCSGWDKTLSCCHSQATVIHGNTGLIHPCISIRASPGELPSQRLQGEGPMGGTPLAVRLHRGEGVEPSSVLGVSQVGTGPVVLPRQAQTRGVRGKASSAPPGSNALHCGCTRSAVLTLNK